jgi:hypothetical protein
MRLRRTGAVVGAAVLAFSALVVGASPASAASCGVRSGTLWCTNRAPVAMQDKPSWSMPQSWQVNTLRSSYSWFKCWSTGEIHPGHDYTWYYTLGDDNGNWGWVPGSDLDTTEYFDRHASDYGLPQCQYNFG